MNLEEYYQKIDLYCLSNQVELQESKIKQSFLHQFDYYKIKISEAVNIMRQQEQVQTYSIMKFISNVWKILVGNQTAVHFYQNSNTDKIDLLCEKMKQYKTYHSTMFNEIFGEALQTIKFPIKSQQGIKANQTLQNMFLNKSINVVIGVLDLIQAFKKLVKLQQDQYIQLLLLNLFIQNKDQIQNQAYYTSLQECKQYSNVIKGQVQVKVKWNGIPIDIQIFKNYIKATKNHKLSIKKDQKYLEQSKYMKKLISQISTSYNTSFQCDEQIRKIIELQILYFKIINQYNNLLSIEMTKVSSYPPIQQKNNIFNTLLDRLNEQSIDFSFVAQIKIQLPYFKSRCFCDLTESSNINQVGQKQYCLFGQSKSWCFKWRSNNQVRIIYYNYNISQTNKDDHVVNAKSALQKRNQFKQKITKIFQNNTTQNLNSVITQIYLIFLYQIIRKYIQQIKNDPNIKQI